MDCTRTHSRIGVIPAWLESRGLPEESLQAAVKGLGTEILRGLCAHAKPTLARVRLCSLSTQTFPLTMYVKLCCFMESFIDRKGSEQPVVRGCENDSEMVGRIEILQVKVEDEFLVGPKEEGSYTEDWRQVELIRKSPYPSASQSFTPETPLKSIQPVSTDKKRQHCTPGYHAECYRHFCNITTINRAIARCRRKKVSAKNLQVFVDKTTRHPTSSVELRSRLILRVEFIMDKWTLQQRALIVELYFRNGCSVVCAQREYRRAHGVRIAPTDKAIRRWVTAFRQTGSVADAKRSGRPRSVRTAANITAVQEDVVRSPNKSCKRRSHELQISETSLCRIMKKGLPHKTQDLTRTKGQYS
uniref:DUF4817 domain-containing protein n=1 Tax=Eptatretus burgeri TaxID=7764 RepID=A0A8C4QMI7_EPTBU